MSQTGAASVVVLAAALVVALLGAAVGAVSVYVGARAHADLAADAAALAAAPVTFRPFGTRSSPRAEAARFAAANGARLVVCVCPVDRSWRARVVEVRVERRVSLPLLGPVVIAAASRAEFVPLDLLR